MEDEECLCNPLNWEFYHHQEGLEDLRYSILQTSLELEATIMSAKEEIRRRESELMEIKEVLSNVIKERDESQAKFHKLMMMEKLNTIQHNYDEDHHEYLQISACVSNKINYKQYSSISEPNSASNCSSDCDEKNKNICVELLAEIEKKKNKKEIPEKGKLLKAVMEAGPLLQTLLLAGGPLPQWHHPPPPLHSIHIPPFLKD